MTASNYHVSIRVSADRFELRRPEMDAPFVTLPIGQDVNERLAQVLHAEWRWRELAELRQHSSDVQVSLRLVPTELPVAIAGQQARAPIPRKDLSASERLVLREGDYYRLEVSNLTQRDLWISILALDSNGSITLSFPRQMQGGDGLLRAGETRLVPPAQMFRVAPPLGPTLFKLLATHEKIDLGALEQSGYESSKQPAGQRTSTNLTQRGAHQRALPSNSQNPLVRLLIAAAEGNRLSAPLPIDSSSWGVAEALLLQKPGR